MSSLLDLNEVEKKDTDDDESGMNNVHEMLRYAKFVVPSNMTRLLRQSLEYKHQVHGIEISRAQSARANAATVDTGLAPGITFGTHLGFGDLPYRNNFFKHVLSQQAFSHCPDRVSTFKEIFRVLQPGGQLAFQDIFLGLLRSLIRHKFVVVHSMPLFHPKHQVHVNQQ